MEAGFWSEIEARQGRWDPLVHPFCERWIAGELGSRELAAYASEYDHAVLATATASRRAARLGGFGELAGQAAAERVHVDLWRLFAGAAGWGGWCAWAYAEDPLEETLACAAAWRGEEGWSLVEHLVTLAAIQATEARVSGPLLGALLDHYGFSAGSETEYFRLHDRLDPARVRAVRSRLDPLLEDAELEPLLARVDAVRRSFWGLLDGVGAMVAR